MTLTSSLRIILLVISVLSCVIRTAYPDSNVPQHSNMLILYFSFSLFKTVHKCYNPDISIPPDSLNLSLKETPNPNKEPTRKRSDSKQSGTSSAYPSGSGFHIPDRHGRKFSFRNENEELTNLLLGLGQILEEQHNFNFLIVISLDNILSQNQTHNAEASPKKSDFEQDLLKDMVDFIKNYPNAFWVYNLTHPLQPEALKEINKDKKFTYSNHQTSIKLPLLDAVIANTGTQIIKHSGLSSKRILTINKTLKQWAKEDNGDPVKKVKLWQGIGGNSDKPFFIFDNINPSRMTGANLSTFPGFVNFFNDQLCYRFGMFPEDYQDGINEKIVNDRLQGKPEPDPYSIEKLPHTILTPFEEEGVLKQVLFSNTRVNKGVALRALINLMSIDGDLQEKPTFLIILGDNIVDLPMIRIDQKANALSQLTERQKTLAKSSITSLIDSSHEASSQIIWLMSIAFNNLNLQSLTNPHVSEMLKHEKVKMVNGEPGLLTDMKAIVDQLKSTDFSMWDYLLSGH